MENRQVLKFAFISIFILATLVRIAPAIVNRDANDDHFQIVEIIAYENRIPGKEELDCLQCYHPKLYHLAVAGLVKLFSADLKNGLPVLGQLLSVSAGLLTLVLAYLLLRKLPIGETTRFFSFLLLALNPSLVGINIQGTNDSFVILFSSMALYFLYRFLKEETALSFLLMLTGTVLAALSKGSGLVILLGISTVLLIRTIANHSQPRSAGKYLAYLGIFIVLSLPPIAAFSPYDEYFAAYGSPLVINKEKSSAPHFFEKTYVGGKTALVSIYDGYFTFHIFDLIKHPFLDRESLEGQYPPSRTSLFTQLYARAAFIQYEGRPKDWFTKTKDPVYDLGRVIFLIGLIPLALFLFGLFVDMKKRLYELFRSKLAALAQDCSWIFPFFFFVFLLSIIKFTFEYREVSAMKPIYIYPAVLSFVYFFSLGLDTALEKIKNQRFRAGILLSLGLLSFLSVLDIASLFFKLL